LQQGEKFFSSLPCETNGKNEAAHGHQVVVPTTKVLGKFSKQQGKFDCCCFAPDCPEPLRPKVSFVLT
jgi:hypothetical protein